MFTLLIFLGLEGIMDIRCKKGINTTIYEVNPFSTYFIAEYKDKVIKGSGLHNTGWNELPNGIIVLLYHLSNGKIITIPEYDRYLHLV